MWVAGMADQWPGPLEPSLADGEKFFAALAAQCAPIEVEKRAQCLVDRRAELLDSLLWQPVCPAQRLRPEMVAPPHPREILGRQSQRFRRLLGVPAVPPQDRGAAFGRDHRIYCMLH